MRKTILITGSSGLVGSEAVKFFSKKKFNIIGIDNNFRKSFFGKEGDIISQTKENIKNIKNFKHFNYDISDHKKLSKIFQKFKFDYIFHAAAQPSHDWAKKNIFLDFRINAVGTLNLLNLMKTYCSKAVFAFISTNKVYGSNPNKLNVYELKNRYDLYKKSKNYNGIDEKMNLDDTIHSFFGVSKLSADIMTQEFGRNFNLKTAVFRAGCITGPNHASVSLHGFLNFLIKCNLEKRPYDIIGYKGKQVRDNLHSYDLVSAVWQYFKKPLKGEIFNIGGGRENSCSILEAINKIENITGLKFKTKIINKPRVGDHRWYITNLNKFRRVFPKWKIKYNLDLIIDQIVESYSK